MWYTIHIHNSLEILPQQYCPHVLDLQVRRRSIVNVTAKSKPASTVDLRTTVVSKKTYTSKRRTTCLKLHAKVKEKYEWNQKKHMMTNVDDSQDTGF